MAAQGQWQSLSLGPLSDHWRCPFGQWTKAATILLAGDGRRFEWVPGEGILVNGSEGRTTHLVSLGEWSDCELHVEFLIPKGSNSGVYLMGRYEIQIYDSFLMESPPYPGIECGGIYPRWVEGRNVEGHSPLRNVARPAGEWQSFDIIFRAPRFDAKGRKVEPALFVEVRHNGVVVHQNVAVSGPTRAALFVDEQPSGPLMLQGDHGPVAYRNIRIRAI